MRVCFRKSESGLRLRTKKRPDGNEEFMRACAEEFVDSGKNGYRVGAAVEEYEIDVATKDMRKREFLPIARRRRKRKERRRTDCSSPLFSAGSGRER